jgi:flagellar hook-associated protein 1 FlgK
MSGFSTLNTAISGLYAAQRGIDVTAQNVANANTEGYSRQRVQFGSVGQTTAAHFYTGNNAAVLAGVQVEGVYRIRDAFLEAARVNAGATMNALGSQRTTLSRAEGLLNEPGANGIQTSLDTFFNSWQDLATTSGDATKTAAAGAVVLQNAKALTAQMKFVATGISENWDDASGQLQNVVGQVNRAATDLAQVNQRIIEGTVSGRPVAELLDRRDQLVRTIGELTGARAVPAHDGTVNVLVGGITLVGGGRAEQFTVAGATSLLTAETDPPRIMFGDVQVPVGGGTAAGLLSSLGTDLPQFNNQMNDVALALRDVVNIQHQAGYTLDGDAAGDFFGGSNASDLTVVPTDGSQLAVASAPGVVDGANALAIADLAQDDSAQQVLGREGPSAQLRGVVASIGTKVQGLTRAADVQNTVLGQADAAVNSDAGVSIDEEMTNLLQYQRAFQANSRVISAVDEIMDTLINRTAA